MSQFFRAETPAGTHRVTAYTRNDFTDGRLRIEPPVQANQDFWDAVGGESKIKFSESVSNGVATMIGFYIDTEVPMDPIPRLTTPHERISSAVGILLEELAQLENINEFLEIGAQRPEEVGIL